MMVNLPQRLFRQIARATGTRPIADSYADRCAAAERVLAAEREIIARDHVATATKVQARDA